MTSSIPERKLGVAWSLIILYNDTMTLKPINYPGLEEYSISPEGVVIGKDGVRKISQFKISRGYMQVGLYMPGSGKRKFSVARLVAMTYVPNPDNKPQVDHIDGNKLNNHASNLQWLTSSENIAKAFQQGRIGSRKGKLSGKITGLYLSHEARAILGTVDNKSKFVDKLIKESQKNTPSPKNTEQKNFSATPSNIDDLIKQAPEYDPEIAKKQLSGEMNCCQNERPCKHWVWDSSTGEGYKNTLSGRFREVA